MVEYKYQILRRDVDGIVETVIANYQNARYLQRKTGVGEDEPRVAALNSAVYGAIEDLCERPRDIEYDANLRFLILIYAYRKVQKQIESHEYVSVWRLEFLGDVIAELLAIKARYERSNDKKSEDFRAPVRDENGDELDDKLLDLAFACFRTGDWKTFDDWRKCDLYSVAVVSLG